MSDVIANGTAMVGVRDDDVVCRPTGLFEGLFSLPTGDIPGSLVGYYENTAIINKGFQNLGQTLQSIFCIDEFSDGNVVAESAFAIKGCIEQFLGIHCFGVTQFRL
jgi:hypothetical protein